MDGHDEIAYFADEHRSTAHRITDLLGRTICEVANERGDLIEAGPSLVRQMTLGDRELLVLGLREVTFRVTSMVVVPCASVDCDETLQIPLHADELSRWARTQGGRLPSQPRWRLPTGVDHEAISSLAIDDPDAAAAELLIRCGADADDATAQALLERELDDLDPLASLELVTTCVGCGAEVTSHLDAWHLLATEMEMRRSDLEHSVHLIASTYHWTEDAILSLSLPRRRRYAELIAESWRARQAHG